MKKCVIKIFNESNLMEAFKKNLPYFSLNNFLEILKNKDIKVNGIRISSLDYKVKKDDELTLFYSEDFENKMKLSWYNVIYEDEFVLVVFKRAGIEVVSEVDRDLVSILSVEKSEVFAVHRIDRNTEGLVIFAKNLQAKNELDFAFVHRLIHKFYLLEVNGKIDLTLVKDRIYIKKLLLKSKVLVSDVLSTGYESATTKFSVVKYKENSTILQAELVSGKTHQIRAHIAYYGYPIIGDGKYGKQTGDCLHLTSYKMSFNFKSKSILKYLNDFCFQVEPTWI